MILRSTGLRHGRLAVSASVRRSCVRTLSTDNRQPPAPTTFAEPPPFQDPESPDFSASSPSDQQTTPVSGAPWAQTQGGLAPQASWTPKKQQVKADKSIAEYYKTKVRMDETIGSYGSVVTQRFDPSSLLREPPMPEDVSLELLMASQTHMGHHKSLWNPSMQRYIYGVRSGIHIFSLEEIRAALLRAARVVEGVAFLGGLILFVGNRKGQMEITARAAELAGACHLFTKWTPGTITNRDQLLNREAIKVVNERDEELEGYERHVQERRPLMPDLVVVLNPLENYTMLMECAQENIPTIGLIDSDADPTQVTYTIPGNDDSLRAVSLVAGVLGRAGERGQKMRLAQARSGVCTWRTPAEIEAWKTAELAREEDAKEDTDDNKDNKKKRIKDELDLERIFAKS